MILESERAMRIVTGQWDGESLGSLLILSGELRPVGEFWGSSVELCFGWRSHLITDRCLGWRSVHCLNKVVITWFHTHAETYKNETRENASMRKPMKFQVCEHLKVVSSV